MSKYRKRKLYNAIWHPLELSKASARAQKQDSTIHTEHNKDPLLSRSLAAPKVSNVFLQKNAKQIFVDSCRERFVGFVRFSQLEEFTLKSL